VPDRPNGEPKAITGSPIERDDEFPIAISGRFPFLIEMIARSYSEFRPTIVAGRTSPLFNSTSIFPETAAVSITWLLVIINELLAFDLYIEPEPVPLPLAAATSIETTEGETS